MAAILDMHGRPELSVRAGSGRVVEADPDSVVVMPAGFPLSEAKFARSGDNLTVRAPDGEEVFVRGYFQNGHAPDIVSPDGAHISGGLAEQLTGPTAPETAAGAGTDAATGPVGAVDTSEGMVIAVHADGTRVELHAGDSVFRGDVLETAGDGAVGVTLVDGSTFAMVEGGRVAFDTANQEGALSLSVMKGVFTFASALIPGTDTDAMTIVTALATLTLRDAQAGVSLADAEHLHVVLLPGADLGSGEVIIVTDAGVQILDQPLQAVRLSGQERALAAAGPISADDLAAIFGGPISVLAANTVTAGDDGADDAVGDPSRGPGDALVRGADPAAEIAADGRPGTMRGADMPQGDESDGLAGRIGRLFGAGSNDPGDDVLTSSRGEDILLDGSGSDLSGPSIDGAGQDHSGYASPGAPERGGEDVIQDFRFGDALRFEGNVSVHDLHIRQDGRDAVITFGSGSGMGIRLEQADESRVLGYSVTDEGRDVVIVADESFA